MKKLTLLFAALVLSFTAQAAIINGTPNPGEKGRLNWWVNGVVESTPVTQPGDTIVLADGEYEEGSIDFNKEGLVVMAAEGAKPVIKASSYLKIHATTTFEGITFDGLNTATYAIGSRGTEEKNLTLKNCEFKNYVDCDINIYESTSINKLTIDSCVFDGTNTTPIAIYGKGSTSELTITNSEFKNYTEYCITANDYYKGYFEKVSISNSLFHDSKYSAIYLYQATEGNPQSCTDFQLTNSTIYNIGNNPTETDLPKRAVVEIRGNSTQRVLVDHVTIYNFPTPDYCGAIKIENSSNATISNCIVMNPDDIYKKWITPFLAYAGAKISNSVYYNCDITSSATATQEDLTQADPMFVDAANADFMLYAESPAIGMGDPRWGVKAGLKPGSEVLSKAVAAANDGDTIVLGDGEYIERWSYNYNKADLVVMAAEGAKPVIKANSYMKHYATTTFIGITFDGQNAAEYAIYSYDNTEKDLTFINCELKNYTKYCITAGSSAHIDKLLINNCIIHDCGNAVYMPASGLENNVHTCSDFEMANSTVYNIEGASYVGAIDIQSNGGQEGMQNKVRIDHVTLYNFLTSGYDGGIKVYKSADAIISNCIVMNPEQKEANPYRLFTGAEIKNSLYFNTKYVNNGATTTNLVEADPLFVDATNANFKLMPLSPARGAATDGSDLGDPRWYTPLTKYIVTATANPTEGGTVTGAGEYIEGVEVTLVATPKYGYNFVNWTKGEEVVSEIVEYTFTPSANVELVANFQKQDFTGNVIYVEPGKGTLKEAVENAGAGDKLVLKDGTYELGYISGGLLLNKEGLIITAAENAKPVILYTDAGACLQVEASTTFEGITFDGGEDKPSFFITTYGVAVEDIVVYNCEFKNYNYFAISDQWSKGCHIGSLKIDNCLFHHGGSVVRFSETGLNSENPCDYFEMKNSTVYDIDITSQYVSIIDIPSLGTGSVENEVIVDHCTFYNCVVISTDYATIKTYTLNYHVSNTIFAYATATDNQRAIHNNGLSVEVKNCLTYNYNKDNGGFRGNETVKTKCLMNTDPLFVDAANNNFMLQLASPAIGKATDGSNLGDPRWGVEEPTLITLTTGDNDAVIEANIGKTVNVKIARSFKANDGYYTLCVPFNMPASVIGTVYEIDGIEAYTAGQDGGLSINLDPVTNLLAGVPYLVYPKENMNELVVEGVIIANDKPSEDYSWNNGMVKLSFQGCYSADGKTDGATEYYIGNGGYLYNNVVDKRGLCGFFTITDNDDNPVNIRARVVTREEVETGLDNNQLPNTNIQKVLENGQLIIIRDGVKYNVQGQKL